MSTTLRLQRVYVPYSPGQRCSVPGCVALAVVTVALVDYYPRTRYGREGGWFKEQDQFTPFLCDRHLAENQYRGKVYGPRQASEYPFTNQCGAAGWSEYLPLTSAVAGRRRSA